MLEAIQKLVTTYSSKLNKDYKDFILQIVAIVTGCPEIGTIEPKIQPNIVNYPVFTVMTFGCPIQGKEIGEPFIKSRVGYNYYLNESGQEFNAHDASHTAASKAQVAKCVSKLTEAQLSWFIKNNATALL